MTILVVIARNDQAGVIPIAFWLFLSARWRASFIYAIHSQGTRLHCWPGTIGVSIMSAILVHCERA